LPASGHVPHGFFGLPERSASVRRSDAYGGHLVLGHGDAAPHEVAGLFDPGLLADVDGTVTERPGRVGRDGVVQLRRSTRLPAGMKIGDAVGQMPGAAQVQHAGNHVSGERI
jgi:hypothetical protein